MPNENKDFPVDVETDPKPEAEEERPELEYDPGEIAPCWASPFPDAELTPDEEKELKELADKVARYDVAARRWEVEQSWQARLFDRGYQYLWPRKGGGWIYIPFATDYQRGRSGQAFYGNENNIYASYGEIITAALTRDIPAVRFSPQNPDSDADITAKNGATNYARIFARNNDLLKLHHQLVYFLRTDGRALIVTDHIIDAQQFGRCNPENATPVVPETEEAGPQPVIYFLRHGETDRNKNHEERGRDEVSINSKGDRQMDRAGDWLKDKNIKAIISSPVERALESAQIVSDELKVPLDVDDRLASLNLGDAAGQDVESASEDIREAFEERPDEPLEGGESPNDFKTRIREVMPELLQMAANGPIVVVVHDSVISEIYNIFQGEDVPPGSQTEPGWIVALVPNEDGTFKPSVCYPVTPPESSVGEQRGKPRGQEVAKVYGKLEHKVPFSAMDGELSDGLWVQASREYDVAYVKAMFPDKADKIRTGGMGSGENELDRIARINATLALEASYVTGDSMVRDCTVQRTWMRPGYFMEVEDVGIRRSLFQKFPDGALVIQAGGAFIKARNESMDDHCTLVHAFPGSGMNRQALCSKLLSVQKRVNNWIDLLDQFFIKCIPMRYMAQGPFDVQAIKNQGIEVGGYVPFIWDNIPPGHSLADLIWMEPFPQAQPLMGEFIRFFLTDLPQMLSHALPSLFGAIANTDTATGVVVQRDQALGSLGSPWHSIRVATASYFRQAVQLAARCRTQAIDDMDIGGVRTRIELAELKGNVQSYPEEDPNFPETSTQEEMRWREMLQDQGNALFSKLMTRVENRIKAIQALRLKGVKDPDEDSWEKQKGEFELLLSSGPVPNPEYEQAVQAIEETRMQVQGGTVQQTATPEMTQALAQMEQQLQQIPKEVSSVPLRPSDNNEVEAACCLEKINSPVGRRLAEGNEKERLAFQNLTLHWQEHSAKIQPDLTLKDLPRGVNTSIKDLPPDAAATVLTASGMETKGADVVQTKEFNTELDKSKKIGGPSVPGVQQQ